MLTTLNTRKEVKFFDEKLKYTTGPAELHSMIERGEDITIIDVRHSEDFGRSHIGSAVSLPESEWDSFKGLSKDRINIVYCYSQQCHLAAKACKFFAEHGYPVMELEGGFDAWKSYSLPLES